VVAPRSGIGRCVVPGLLLETTRRYRRKSPGRAVRSRLDSHIDRPWLRETAAFKHPDLALHDQRRVLGWAALVLIQARLRAGRLAGDATLGRMNPGAMSSADLDGSWNLRLPGQSHRALRSSRCRGALRALVELWWEMHTDAAVTVADLFTLVSETDTGLDLGIGNRCRSHLLPFADDCFDVVLHRHEELTPEKVARSATRRVVINSTVLAVFGRRYNIFPRGAGDLYGEYLNGLEQAGLRSWTPAARRQSGI
jgi:hypothetical protein